MSSAIRAWAADQPRGALKAFEYDPGALHPEQVEIQVEHCGICHSDLSMLDNEWRSGQFPIVPGHEIVGVIGAVGPQVKGLEAGQRVGLGWFSSSCMHCERCLAGDHNLCAGSESTIIGRHGGFAERVRCHWSWAIPLPEGVDAKSAGPLFCGGITVFNPIVQMGVRPTDRVGVVGIGGLGHLAVKFLHHWGCEVTAFTSSESKRAEALSLGAHHAVPSRDTDALKKLRGTLDFILVTVNVPMDWGAYLAALRPRGRLHVVGGITEPMAVPVFSLMGGQKSVSASPLGSPATIRKMLEFCARHAIAPTAEFFPMAKVNDAIEHLRAGKARYRVILQGDWK